MTSGTPIDVQSVHEFQQVALKHAQLLVYFWASWSEPCQLLDGVILGLLSKYPGLACAKVEAEEVPDVSRHLHISAVPTVVMLQKGDEVDRLEGYDPSALAEKAEALVQAGSGSPASGPAPEPPTVQSLEERLKALVRQQPVMLFMKGSPDAPRCGFSRKVVEALRNAGTQFGYFDILLNEEIRQGLKTLSDWPTYPQLYAGGELLGGCDIVLEMASTGELKGAVEEALRGDTINNVSTGGHDTAGESAGVLLEDRLRALKSQQPVMLFMKGTPTMPRCGFSSRVVEALRKDGIDFGYFDILSDEEVRQGLKALSDWPTYPQLYAGGELLGGSDIVMELASAGDLRGAVQEALH